MDETPTAEAAAAEVCHEAQLVNWADDLTFDILDWLRPVQDYEDSVELQRALRHAIRGIVRSAFELKERNDAG